MTTTDKTAKYGDALKRILREEGKDAIFPRNLVEKYPHIVDKIYLLWNDPETETHYFSELLTTQRENRAGFPLEIYSEIFALESYYKFSRPAAQKSDDFWAGVNSRD